MSNFMKYGLLIVMGVLNTAIQGLLRYSLKKAGAVDGAAPEPAELLRVLQFPTVWAAMLLQIGALGIWMLVISRMELTYALPLSGAFFTFFLFLQGHFIFHENISSSRIIGAVLIVLGAFLLEERVKIFSS